MKIKLYILLFMLFLHIVDDYYLQGILAQLKQRTWWEKNAPDDLYKNDYIMALIEHGFSWTFMIMLPFLAADILEYSKMNIVVFIFMFVLNWICHCLIDDLKANRKCINLVQDQCMHVFQILLTAFLMWNPMI